ncbi:MAG: hypothetical protein A3I05_09980 [Deltaproteobacteria bacterium RIFCSPLOWO2_02_FULL_44_10]|nr:MAG: hypothetical protein A3C46_09205 [Deltaproteobacteria bacterium RIFCSPHIGHO2_02_FULL_44_16]OGQ45019.1 MAG: hypothetical protein A3I05_09980 [Deltaproteobacteria bacterium RIFCSPLOWO2_02_FULL_44_10]
MILEQNRSIIPACDVSVIQYEALIKATHDLPGIGAYKIGFMLGLSIGLPKAVEIARRYTDKPLIYDHQKAGTDIPDTGISFAKTCKDAGIDAVIFFPQAGPETEKAWIEAAREQELGVIVGGVMTHKAYTLSDGGWIDDKAIDKIYLTAARCGVTDFVVPATKLEIVRHIRRIITDEGVDASFYAPGIGAQGGDYVQIAETAGSKFHAIIGRALYGAKNMRVAAETFCKLIAENAL